MSFLMNNRGLMERVVLEVGLDLGVIPRSVFTMPVFHCRSEHGHHRSLALGRRDNARRSSLHDGPHPRRPVTPQPSRARPGSVEQTLCSQYYCAPGGRQVPSGNGTMDRSITFQRQRRERDHTTIIQSPPRRSH